MARSRPVLHTLCRGRAWPARERRSNQWPAGREPPPGALHRQLIHEDGDEAPPGQDPPAWSGTRIDIDSDPGDDTLAPTRRTLNSSTWTARPEAGFPSP